MESFDEVVGLVKAYVKEQVSDIAYNCWISLIEPVVFKENTAVIYVKTPFQRDILEKQYLEKLKAGFLDVLGFEVKIYIATEENVNTFLPNFIKSESEPEFSEEQHQIKDNGNYEYTFDTFIIGSSNNFAYAACKAVCSNQIGSYNPLFIYGPSGLGKTHLLMAIANEIRRKNPEKNVVFISSETFTNDLISAIGTRSIDNFHNKYRKADVLLVDDIQFIAGKESTQEEFFHTFNELYQVGKQIVLTSDRPPKDIKTLEDRLKSRFEWGLLTDISPPDFETRIAIINRKADLLHIDIPIEVSEFIANRLKTNIRQLEGAVKRMEANYRYVGAAPSIAMAQTIIKEILTDNQPIPVTVERIIEEVSKTYSVTPEDIRSKKKNANVSQARQIAMYIVREVTQMSMESIGLEFNRDHSTVVYSLKQMQKQIEINPRQKAMVDDIIKNIKNYH